MDWSKLKTALGTLAPWLAATFGTPVTGMAVKAVCQAFGLDASKATPETLLAAVSNATPEQLAALRAEDNRHAEVMQAAGYQNVEHLESIAAQDRDGARRRQVDAKDNTPATLAYIIIGGFFALAAAQLIAIMGWPEKVATIPAQAWVIVGNISGYLAAEAKAAAAYFFGTTADSGRKTDIIAQAQPVQMGGGNG